VKWIEISIAIACIEICVYLFASAPKAADSAGWLVRVKDFVPAVWGLLTGSDGFHHGPLDSACVRMRSFSFILGKTLYKTLYAVKNETSLFLESVLITSQMPHNKEVTVQ
jgi:hypothetical protein